MVTAASELPEIIQGGMGIGVSGWQLAAAAARAGAMGVVSGVALDTTMVRRLQDGDPGGHLRRAFEAFPVQEIAQSVLARYWNPAGRTPGQPYRLLTRPSLSPRPERQWVSVLAAFAEVHLAKQAAEGRGAIGVNFLEKVQLGNPAAAYGAVLAGVDAVLVGAGIPARFPEMIRKLARHARFELPVDVEGAGDRHYSLAIDPQGVLGRRLADLEAPSFLAIVSSHTLASFLARDPVTRPDGFVVESPVAGGHNAPPRGQLRLDERGEPIYGPRDAADFSLLSTLGLPFWIAGGQSGRASLSGAREAGARGIQVGTLFALCEESGLAERLRIEVLASLGAGRLRVRSDARASPTGFPFKVAELEATMSEPHEYEKRPRSCDLGYLRTPYVTPGGAVGYRCSAEPAASFVRKGGAEADAAGRLCLCNGLVSNIGLAQTRRGGYVEPPAVTLGADTVGAREMLRMHPAGWSASDVVAFLSS